MIQLPIVVGLKLCQQAIIEEKTKNITLVNCFHRLEVSSFPSPAQPFTICVVLTDGLGNLDMEIKVELLATMESIYRRTWHASFPKPLAERWFLLRASACSFPVAAGYRVVLFANDELLAQTKFEVIQAKE